MSRSTLEDYLGVHTAAGMGLTMGCVHVWRVRLDSTSLRLGTLSACLSGDEIQRARRFRFEEDQSRFMVARANLRIILGRYLSTEPRGLHFHYDSSGKPALAPGFCLPPGMEGASLQFNLSHSNMIALYVFAWNRAVGIDVEYFRWIRKLEAMVQQVCSPEEMETLRSLPALESQLMFLRYWTRKEAYGKADGKGLSAHLGCLDTSGMPLTGSGFRTVRCGKDPRNWSILDLQPANQYIAALAVEGSQLPVQFWENSDDID